MRDRLEVDSGFLDGGQSLHLYRDEPGAADGFSNMKNSLGTWTRGCTAEADMLIH